MRLLINKNNGAECELDSISFNGELLTLTGDVIIEGDEILIPTPDGNMHMSGVWPASLEFDGLKSVSEAVTIVGGPPFVG